MFSKDPETEPTRKELIQLGAILLAIGTVLLFLN